MTTHTDFARPVDRTLYEAPGRPAPDVPASLALHARQTAEAPLPGAPVSFASVPGLPDVMRPAGASMDIDRTLHPSFPTPTVVVVEPATPLPGTVPATAYDPWRPLQHLPAPAPTSSPRPLAPSEGHGPLDADLAAAQFATVATSRAKLDRARTYAGRLGAHAAEIRGRLSTASAHQVAAAIGKAEPDAADLGPLRGEAIGVERQHGQALAILAEVEAEHARHEADLAAITGSDGAARAKLTEAHAARALAQEAADKAKGILDRATAHRSAVDGKLAAARADETRHDADATARLRAALADGDAPPAAAEPLTRVSDALEDDLRAATAAVDALTMEHAAKVSALAAAHRAVLGAVDGVLTVDADAMAREVSALDAHSKLLHARLAAYAARTPGDYVAPPWTPPKNVLHPGGWYTPEPGKPTTPPQPPKVLRTAAISAVLPLANDAPLNVSEVHAWTAYATGLTRDPQAEPSFANVPRSLAPSSAPFPGSASATTRFPTLPVRTA